MPCHSLRWSWVHRWRLVAARDSFCSSLAGIWIPIQSCSQSQAPLYSSSGTLDRSLETRPVQCLGMWNCWRDRSEHSPYLPNHRHQKLARQETWVSIHLTLDYRESNPSRAVRRCNYTQNVGQTQKSKWRSGARAGIHQRRGRRRLSNSLHLINTMVLGNIFWDLLVPKSVWPTSEGASSPPVDIC